MDRWKTTDEKLKEMLKKYNKLNKRTQDKIQEVFDSIDFNGQNLFDIASKRTLDKVNRKIEEYVENNEINEYTKYRINKVYRKSRIKNNEVLDFLIFMCFLEERNTLTKYENNMFQEIINKEYKNAQKEVYTITKEDKKVMPIGNNTYNKILSSPNPKGYVWDEYILATLLFNSEQIYRQTLIELQQNRVLDITNDVYQNLLKSQRNRYLSIKDGEVKSGDLELQTLYMVNSSIKEGYIKADNNAKVRFIAEMDKRTTDMCETLNDQVFSVNDWNTYQRWSAADNKMVVYKTFGLEAGANLPPINNHFHWCRSTITYQVDKYDYQSLLKAKHLSKSENRTLMRYISSDSYKVNNLLYSNLEVDPMWNDFIIELDNALAKMPKYKGYVNRSVNVYSKQQLNQILSIFDNEDKIGCWASYVSSSLDMYDGSFNMQIGILSKTGRNLTMLNGEGGGEILFERNTMFKLVDYKKKYGKILIELEEI